MSGSITSDRAFSGISDINYGINESTNQRNNSDVERLDSVDSEEKTKLNELTLPLNK